MRKTLIFFFVLAIILTPIAVVQAQFFGPLVPCGTERTGGSCGWKDIVTLARNVIKFMISFSVIIATIMFVYAGFQYLTAGGDETKIKSAHKVFTNVFIGLVFVLGGFLIVDMILKAFEIKVNPLESSIHRPSDSSYTIDLTGMTKLSIVEK